MKKIIKGKIYFYYKDGKIENEAWIYSKEELEFVNLFPTEYDIYDLFSGEEFAEYIEDRGIIDNDGTLADIFVDDFKSNLGIWDDDMHKGEFCVALKDFKKLCKDYNIEVNWANK